MCCWLVCSLSVLPLPVITWKPYAGCSFLCHQVSTTKVPSSVDIFFRFLKRNSVRLPKERVWSSQKKIAIHSKAPLSRTLSIWLCSNRPYPLQDKRIHLYICQRRTRSFTAILHRDDEKRSERLPPQLLFFHSDSSGAGSQCFCLLHDV